MRNIYKYDLPDTVKYNKNVYKYLSAANEKSDYTIAKELKAQGKKGVIVNVLSRSLRGKTDLHQQPYKPSRFIFVAEIETK